MNSDDLKDLELKRKYLKKVNDCVDLILSVFNELNNANSYRFCEYGKNLQFFKPGIRDLKQRAWYIDGTIYLTEDVLIQNKKNLIMVLLHELLHHNYPDKTENEIVKLTNEKMQILRNSHLSLLL